MTETVPLLITDPDLLAELDKHKGTFGYDVMRRSLERTQAARDAEHARRAALSRDARRRDDARQDIEATPANLQDLRFMHSVLAVCGLPYRRLPPDQLEYERRQGRMAVVVTAGKLRSPDGSRVQQPIPFGPKARLLLAHLTTQAIVQKSPTIEIADSLSAFIHDMGFPVTGGAKGTLKAFKDQINALAACRMELSSWDGLKSKTIDTKPFESIDLWLPTDPDQRMLWPSQVTFSPSFFEALKRRAIPLDMRVLRAFAGSARKLDLYMWASYRLHTLEAPLLLSWTALQDQFGDGFARPRDFKAQLADDIRALAQVFPELPLALSDAGLTLSPAKQSALTLPRSLGRKA